MILVMVAYDVIACGSIFWATKWKGRVEHVGAKPSYDPQGPLVV